MYLFDSHAVNEWGKNDMCEENNKARLFTCADIDSLAHLLLINSAYDGNRRPYNIHRISFEIRSNDVGDRENNEVTVSESKQTNLANVSIVSKSSVTANVDTTTLTSTRKVGRPKKVKRGPKPKTSVSTPPSKKPKIIVHSNIIVPRVDDEIETTSTHADDVLPPPQDDVMSVVSTTESCPAALGKISNISDNTLECNKGKRGRKASDVSLEERRKIRNKTYRSKNAATLLEAAKHYQVEHPESRRKADKKYNQLNSEIRRKIDKRYRTSNPDVYQQAVKRYRTTQQGKHLPVSLRRRFNMLIGEFKTNEEYAKISQFALKNSSLLDRDNCCKCPHCGAPLFHEELDRKKWCCGQNLYNVQQLKPLDATFYKNPLFLAHPRHYNDLFAFCAMVTKWKHKTGLGFMKIQGRTYHKVHDLNLKGTSYANQSYMYIDDGDARRMEASKFDYLKKEIIDQISRYLDSINNPFVKHYRRLSLEPSDQAHLVFECKTRRQAGPVLGEQPQSTEVAAVINTTEEAYDPRSIVIWKVGKGEKQRILNVFHPLMEPMQYPLLYPHGETGWGFGKYDKRGGKLSQLRYIRCLLLSDERFTAFNKLSETWLVDMYCRIEEERLNFIRRCQRNTNAGQMRVATLAEVRDVAELNQRRDDIRRERQNLGEDETIQGEGFVAGKIYLPHSFTGGPRFMKIKYMNAMAVVERLGIPDYFLTFTANGQWPEIKASTHKSCKMGEPQVVNRVFKLYLDELLRDLRSGRWFGDLVYFIYTIEFQMRGLPHAHIVFKVKDGPIQTTDVDRFIRADIPAENEAGGELRRLVLRHMIHGPFCARERRPGSNKYPPCFDQHLRKCSKFFPKKSSSVTYVDNHGFYNYKRDDQNKVAVRFGSGDVEIDDTWVVSYNAPLLLKYNCHLNLDKCSGRSVVHYLFKYITKEPAYAKPADQAADQPSANSAAPNPAGVLMETEAIQEPDEAKPAERDLNGPTNEGSGEDQRGAARRGRGRGGGRRTGRGREKVNPFIKDFRRLALEPSEKAHLVFECTTRRRAGPILGEQPQSTEVAAVISLIDEPNDPRQICIWKNGEGKRQLNVFHPIMEPFQYPLLYPRGELGWTINMKDNQGDKALRRTPFKLLPPNYFYTLLDPSINWRN
ncbi:unnamed protein product [Phyllotreta striolata]|uniref:Helitron helicase-like domain-containing protein n=2 Tax=Phyllotreta striolata TaxID=444603 RepID=A0A9P0E1N9_PHYSR|nr:unnamed protein product [Phyllotreta striolata]